MCCLLLASSLVLAANPASLDSLNSRLVRTQNLIEELERREATAVEILVALHEHLQTARRYYNRLAEREAEIVQQLADVRASYDRQDSVRQMLIEELGDYLLFLYAHRRYVRPARLFDESGLDRSIRRQAYLDFLAEKAAREVVRLSQSSDSLSRYEDSLQVLQRDVRGLRQQMAEIQERIYRQEERQASYRQQLSDEIAEAEERASVMEAERRRLSALVAQLRVSSSEGPQSPNIPQPGSDSFFEQNRGMLRWPSRGEVVRGFGVEVHPVYGTETVSDGIQVATEMGASVESPADGEVMYADRYMSLGNTVIVDHQDGFYTIYGYLGSLSVSAGEKVTKGRPVGTAGSLPSGRAGYHFQVRRGGEPVNPLFYLE